MIVQEAVGKTPAARPSSAHPGQTKGSARKKKLRAAREAKIKQMADDYGVTTEQVRQHLYEEAEAARKRRAPRTMRPPKDLRHETERGRINW
jgi:predicted ArsR family transcriptional regulator